MGLQLQHGNDPSKTSLKGWKQFALGGNDTHGLRLKNFLKGMETGERLHRREPAGRPQKLP